MYITIGKLGAGSKMVSILNEYANLSMSVYTSTRMSHGLYGGLLGVYIHSGLCGNVPSHSMLF